MDNSNNDSKGKVHEHLEGASGRESRFRPPRYDANDINDGKLFVRYRDFDGRIRECRIHDISATGLSFYANDNEVMRNGETLEHFEIWCGDNSIYQGKSTIITQRDIESKTIIGCSLQSGFLGTDLLLELKEKTRLRRELQEFQKQIDHFLKIPNEFKTSVSDLCFFLNNYKTKLDQLEKSHRGNGSSEQHELWSREIISLIEEQFAEYFHSQLKQMFEAVRHLDESYREQLRQYAQFHLHSLFEHAPIFHRSYHKPSGYAGDYTIMVMMYFAENHYWGDTLFGKLMHRMGCSLTASKAAISRIAYLTRNIQKRLDEYRGQDPMRIFSLACGPGKELADLLRYNQRSSKALELTLFDQDSEALTYCHSIFTPLRTQLPNVKINYTKSAIRQLITEREYLESLPKQDIITSTGLFDYLKDRTASLLLSNLVELLRPGGTLLIGNLDVTCDTKVVFDNLLDWYMIYRSKEDLLRLASTITQPVDFHIEAEDTGINLFLVVRKKNSGI